LFMFAMLTIAVLSAILMMIVLLIVAL